MPLPDSSELLTVALPEECVPAAPTIMVRPRPLYGSGATASRLAITDVSDPAVPVTLHDVALTALAGWSGAAARPSIAAITPDELYAAVATGGDAGDSDSETRALLVIGIDPTTRAPTLLHQREWRTDALAGLPTTNGIKGLFYDQETERLLVMVGTRTNSTASDVWALLVYDWSVKTTLSFVTSFHPAHLRAPKVPWVVAADGRTIFLAAMTAGTSGPVVARYTLAADALTLVLDATIAITAAGYNNSGGTHPAMAWDDAHNRLFVVGKPSTSSPAISDYLLEIEWSDPESPAIVQTELFTQATHMFRSIALSADGRWAYVERAISGSRQITAIDVSVPGEHDIRDSVQIATSNEGGIQRAPHSLSPNGRYLFTGGGRVVDLIDPEALVLLSGGTEGTYPDAAGARNSSTTNRHYEGAAVSEIGAPSLVVGERFGGRIYRMDASQLEAGERVIGHVLTAPVAPAGISAECAFLNAYLVVEHRACAAIQVIPVVNGEVREDAAQVFVAPHAAAPFTRTYEVSLMVPFPVDNPRVRTALRGTWIQFLIRGCSRGSVDTDLVFHGIEVEWTLQRESLPNVTLAPIPTEEVPESRTLILVMGERGGGKIFEADRGGLDGAGAIPCLIGTAPVVPGGQAGEAVFQNLYFSITHRNADPCTVTVTPIVDEVDLTPVPIELDGVVGTQLLFLEMSLMQAFNPGSGVRSTYAPRGKEFAVRIEIEDEAAAGLVAFDGVELECEVVRETMEAVA